MCALVGMKMKTQLEPPGMLFTLALADGLASSGRGNGSVTDILLSLDMHKWG